MNNSFLRWCAGYLDVDLRGMNQERFINICANHNINLWNMHSTKDGISFNMLASDFKKTRAFAVKSGIKMEVTKKTGLPFFVHLNRKRKLMFAGMLTAVFLIYAMSFFIWDISFEGNVRYTDEVLLKYLNENGYHPLMLKSRITCADIESGIRMEYNDITWVSARIDGSKLVVAVNENYIMEDEETVEKGPEDIVADMDGVITEIITRSGTPLVSAGDTVSKGDVMVSGVLDIVDDSDTVVNRHFTAADADIYAECVLNYTDKIPFLKESRAYTGRKRQRYYLMIKDIKLETLNFKRKFDNSDMQDVQERMVMGNSLFIPVRWGTVTEKEYKNNEYIYSEEEAEEVLSERLDAYIQKIIKKGIQITDKNVKIGKSNDSYVMSGDIVVIMKIGETRPVNTDDYAIENETLKENE